MDSLEHSSSTHNLYIHDVCTSMLVYILIHYTNVEYIYLITSFIGCREEVMARSFEVT